METLPRPGCECASCQQAREDNPPTVAQAVAESPQPTPEPDEGSTLARLIRAAQAQDWAAMLDALRYIDPEPLDSIEDDARQAGHDDVCQEPHEYGLRTVDDLDTEYLWDSFTRNIETDPLDLGYLRDAFIDAMGKHGIEWR